MKELKVCKFLSFSMVTVGIYPIFTTDAFSLYYFKPIRESYSVHINEPVHEMTNNVVCATSKAPDQPAHKRRLIRAFASRLNIL